MCLSRQLRAARNLLSWSVAETSKQTGLPEAIIAHAEMGDGALNIALTQLARLQGLLEAAGVQIGFDGKVALKGLPSQTAFKGDPGES